jgi:RNA polymerase sigma-70 factor (ECF subfamily)
MFGLTQRDGHRHSPLATYSGRGSLKGFLRATLAQRNVDRHRRTHREAPLPAVDPPAAAPSPTPEPAVLGRIATALNQILRSLLPEERFLLSAWYLDQRTLLEISRIISVHEATVSRRIQRVTAALHKELLSNLQAAGMTKAAAEEALGADPRDIDINLRTLLQSSQIAPFSDQASQT